MQNLKMKKFITFVKWAFLTIIGALTVWFLASFAIYRATYSAQEEITAEVHYQVIEINLSNRHIFEGIMGNELVRLDGLGVFYVSPKDRRLLWPKSPHEMRNKNYTIEATIKVRKLIAGGYSVAEVVSTQKTNKQPRIMK